MACRRDKSITLKRANTRRRHEHQNRKQRLQQQRIVEEIRQMDRDFESRLKDHKS